MRAFLVGLNLVALILAARWLVAHTVATHALDLGFWAAFALVTLCLGDVWYLLRGKRDAA